MSKLLDYLNKVEKDVEKWPAWKLESLKNAFQIPDESSNTKAFENPKNTHPLACVKI